MWSIFHDKECGIVEAIIFDSLVLSRVQRWWSYVHLLHSPGIGRIVSLEPCSFSPFLYRYRAEEPLPLSSVYFVRYGVICDIHCHVYHALHGFIWQLPSQTGFFCARCSSHLLFINVPEGLSLLNLPLNIHHQCWNAYPLRNFADGYHNQSSLCMKTSSSARSFTVFTVISQSPFRIFQ